MRGCFFKGSGSLIYIYIGSGRDPPHSKDMFAYFTILKNKTQLSSPDTTAHTLDFTTTKKDTINTIVQERGFLCSSMPYAVQCDCTSVPGTSEMETVVSKGAYCCQNATGLMPKSRIFICRVCLRN